MNTNLQLLEKYQEGASQEIIDAIEARVSIYEPQIVAIKELKHPSSFSARLILNQMHKLAQEFDTMGYLIDITDSKIPDATTRRTLNNGFKEMLDRVKHVSFISGRNILINTSAKFVMRQTPLKSFSIHRTMEEGTAKIREEIKKYENSNSL